MTITVEHLIAEYAAPIATEGGLDASEYATTAEGFASLLLDTADGISPTDQSGVWLTEAAADLDAVARLGDTGAKTQDVLKRIDSALYNAKSDLES
jgi:hypothetical protein